LEIYLGDINLQVQLDEQLQPITQNGTYEIKDMDEDPELEIDGPLPNQQINNRKKTIVKRDDDGNGSKAVANLGQFTVNVQPNLINDYVFRSNGDYDANTIGGYQGFGPRVKVEIDQDLPDIPLIQNDKSFTLNDSGIFTVQPDNGYDGIGQVIVNNNAVDSNIIFQLNTDNANETFTDPNTGRVQLEHSINPSSGNYAMKNVSVYTETQNKEVFVNNNGTITIQPDQGYVGLNQVTINTTVTQEGGGQSSINLPLSTTICYDNTVIPSNNNNPLWHYKILNDNDHTEGTVNGLEVPLQGSIAGVVVAQEWNSQSGNSNSTTKYIKTFTFDTNNDQGSPIPIRYNKNSGYMYEIFWCNDPNEVKYYKYFNLKYNGNIAIGLPFNESGGYSGDVEDIFLPLYDIYNHIWLEIQNNFIIITN